MDVLKNAFSFILKTVSAFVHNMFSGYEVEGGGWLAFSEFLPFLLIGVAVPLLFFAAKVIRKFIWGN